MAGRTATGVLCVAALAWIVGSTGTLSAQMGIGTWVKQATGSSPAMTMSVEACCGSGRRLIYRVGTSDAATMTVESPFDGTDVPVLVLGKPTGQTMGIKRVDDHHAVTVLKMNGQQFGTSTATLSADGKTLTIDSEITAAVPGRTPGKTTETWIKK